MKSITIRFLSAMSVLAGSLLPTSGDVVINEFSADSTERLLRWDENEMPWLGAGRGWWFPDFDDSSWQSGSLPIGHGIGAIKTDVKDEVRNRTPSIYTRKRFTVQDANSLGAGEVTFKAAYNDGFVAFLNGVEIARNNLGPVKSHWYFDQVASRTQRSSDSTKFEEFEAGPANELLRDGENVLVVQVANATLSGTMRLDYSLEAGGADLVAAGSEVKYKIGIIEPSGGLADPAVLANDDLENDFVDWIELRNTGDSAVDLTGWSLTDDQNIKDKWGFPAGTTIPANGYLVVLADAPLSEIPNAEYLHTNFKLGRGGEYLAVVDASGVAQSEFENAYPSQTPFYSYGVNPVDPNGGGYVYFEYPSPGFANGGTSYTGRVDAPDFDNEGGFYDAPVTITLTSETEGALIRFTRDGTEPTETNGEDYAAPINLEQVTSKKGHVIRARAFVDGLITSRTKTNTFLIEQDERIAAAATLIYSGDLGRSLYKPNGVLSVAGGTGLGESWRARDGDDYNYIINRGRAYERPIHGEYYMPGGEVGFRTDMGVRVAASNWSRPRMTFRNVTRSPWTSSATEKPSFNLYFRDDYGDPEVTFPLNGPSYPVDTFEGFRVRAGKNDIDNPFVVDELVRRLHRDMGNAASIGRFQSLYVNGELKGYYNLCERLRPAFFKAHYGTPPGVEWDVLAYGNPNGNIADGDKRAWNEMISITREDMTPENWENVLAVADVQGIIDYYLINIYAAMWDWPHNNWVAGRERSENGRYRLYVWDAEGGFGNRGDSSASKDSIGTLNSGGGELQSLWQRLKRWPQFRLMFADRVNKHMFNGGVLDDRDWGTSHIKKRVDELVVEFEDLQRAVTNLRLRIESVMQQWTRETRGRRAYMFGTKRGGLASNDLWPATNPPEFSTFGGSVENGHALKLTNESGAIYFTTNGEDPRLPSGEPNPNAVSQAGSKLPLSLVEAGSSWKYDDSGTDLGTAWREPGFSDAVWNEGPSPLGYGGITGTDIATQVNVARNNTTYFRKSLEIEDAAATLSLTATVHADAAAVVYVNGTEAFRDGFDAGEITFDSRPESDGNEGVFDEFDIDPSLLRAGTNIIAIELHSRSKGGGSSDMVLDFTLNGTRTNPSNEPVLITKFTTVKARSLDGDEWSALTEADFTVDTVAATSANLAISEFLYNPEGPTQAELDAGVLDGDQFEWIEIRNTGTQAVDLGQVRFTDGVAFDFGEGSLRTIASGSHVIVVSDSSAFATRYGTGYGNLIAGEFTGRLSNSGEQIRLTGADGVTLHEFAYDDATPWPEKADDGHSLQIIDATGDHGAPANWRASENLGGTPGDDGTAPTLTLAAWQASFFSESELQNAGFSGPTADADGDLISNFTEFVFGTSPRDAASVPSSPMATLVEENGNSYVAIRLIRASGARAVDYAGESSSDLSQWAATPVVLVSETPMDGDTVEVIYRDTTPVTIGDTRFLRLRMTAR